jgi:two-component system LytT family response regulator
MLRAVLVDDEEAARQELAQLLEHYCSAVVELAAAAASASEARMLIPQVRPDLVFLDVEMPGENGFALLRSLPRESYGEVVFVTAYDRYAVQALRVSAADYLLKPVQPEELLAAVRARLRAAAAAHPFALGGDLAGQPQWSCAAPHRRALRQRIPRAVELGDCLRRE